MEEWVHHGKRGNNKLLDKGETEYAKFDRDEACGGNVVVVVTAFHTRAGIQDGVSGTVSG